jgi:hypothetical protein
MDQAPCSFATVFCWTAVSLETTEMDALGTTAPWPSVTRPPIVARASWAHAETTVSNKAINAVDMEELHTLGFTLLEHKLEPKICGVRL